ncbi:hypothetical protein NDU88_007883 [Pleurodeles waltl]|uniref:Uncharacterized protein n=1 Tax=Pleurodeles waltl TaxID=8319 RepID=A0AAV7VTW9_PLEWA|nr:hypothetical protein NDU88_007883 [Pleurodeles waltl]
MLAGRSFDRALHEKEQMDSGCIGDSGAVAPIPGPEMNGEGQQRCVGLIRGYKTGTPWKGRRRKPRGRRQRLGAKQSQISGDTHRIPNPTKEQAEEERESVIRAAADLATY